MSYAYKKVEANKEFLDKIRYEREEVSSVLITGSEGKSFLLVDAKLPGALRFGSISNGVLGSFKISDYQYLQIERAPFDSQIILDPLDLVRKDLEVRIQELGPVVRDTTIEILDNPYSPKWDVILGDSGDSPSYRWLAWAKRISLPTSLSVLESARHSLSLYCDIYSATESDWTKAVIL